MSGVSLPSRQPPRYPHGHTNHVFSQSCPQCVPQHPTENPVTHPPLPRLSPRPLQESVTPDQSGRDPDVDPSPASAESRTRNVRAVPALLPLVETVASTAADVASYAGAAYVTYEALSELYSTLRKAYNSFVSAAVPEGYSPRLTVSYLLVFSWVDVGDMNLFLSSCITADLNSPSSIEVLRYRFFALLDQTPPFSDSKRFPGLSIYHLPLAAPFLPLTIRITNFLSYSSAAPDVVNVLDFLSAVRSYCELIEPNSSADALQTYSQETFELRFRLVWS